MRPKQQIAELYDSGVSMRSISGTVNLSISTISMILWACMSRSGVGHVRLVQGNLNATQYVEILEENLAPSIETMGLDDLKGHLPTR